MKGFSDVLVGLQYGDEGKARIIDAIGGEYDVIARFNGGPNAGHTVEVGDKKIALHQIPSGIFHPNIFLYVGSGCVLNLEKLIAELNEVRSLGVNLDGRLMISDQATVILPHHILLDQLLNSELGTTNNGIGPAYSDQALRIADKRLVNVRLGDIVDDSTFAKQSIIESFNEVSSINKCSEINNKADSIIAAGIKLRDYICKNPLWLDQLVCDGKKVLFEGAQASMLDVIKGTVPFVTSSHTIAGSAYVGGDLPPNYHRKTIGVAKAIMSRVGRGPFVSEFGGLCSEEYCNADNGKKHSKAFEQSNYSSNKLLTSLDKFELGIALRMLGDEYGSTTQRPRRIGMLDLVQLAYTCRLNGVNELYLNKCDCLIDFSRTIAKFTPVVTSYCLNNERIQYVPTTSKANRNVVPVIEYFPSFGSDISGIRTYEALPEEVKVFLTGVEKYAGCKIAGIGVGPKREQFILIK